VRADRAELLSAFPFTPDRFQLEAFDAFDRGENVVVAAPTASGKTAVAEYGIAATLRDDRRSFYTAPIKALSNQKFRDLTDLHGSDSVGLLTGDHAINADAPVVVMTTEVLRNMIYGGRRLNDLGMVVLDEVHFLQDTYRGPVWEEVIIHLPPHVQLVCLSATISNVGQLTEWITTVRGPTAGVVETKRPVELANRYLVGDRTNDRVQLMPMFVSGGVNSDARKLDESAVRGGGAGRGRGRNGRGRRQPPAGRRVLATPGRIETVDILADKGLLPAIYFIFSRAQCEEAAQACVDVGLVLTGPEERDQITTIVDQRLADLNTEDAEALGVERFVTQLLAGVAPHHAGMVPAMKETVEACFVADLIDVVFATETLALGINMPARSVVIEKLTKFTGDHHERLTPGEYTQLTGRAGRRGLDDVGDAVVLWSPWVRFDEVVELASSTSFHLRSAFRPTYNMTANMIRTVSHDEATKLLNLSFAQFQADRDIVRLEARLVRRQAAAAEAREAAASPFGDIDEYRRIVSAENAARRDRRDRNAGRMRGAMAALRPGTVIDVVKGTYKGPAVVVANAHRSAGVKLTLVARTTDLLKMTADDFDEPPRSRGRIKLPPDHAPNRKEYRREVAKRLRVAKLKDPTGGPRKSAGAHRPSPSTSNGLAVARDPDLDERVRAAARAERLEREVADLERRIGGKTQSLAQEFDRVLEILERFACADVSEWHLTDRGETLSQIFHESDLLLSEATCSGIFDGLEPPDLAAIVSCVIYEHRSPENPPPPWFSSPTVEKRWRRLDALSSDIRAHERSLGLAEHRPPDPTFAAAAHAWVAGEEFSAIVDDEEFTGGDFVRNVKQVIDVVRQLALVAPDRATQDAARRAAESAFRGIVAESSVTRTS